MALDKLLKDTTASLEQIMKQPVFDKVGAAALALPETQRNQRIADLDARIAALNLRRDQAVTAFNAAIAGDEAERDLLKSAGPSAPPVRAVPTRRAAAKSKTKRKKRR